MKADTMNPIEAIVRASPSEENFENRLRHIANFTPREELLCWFYGRHKDFIYIRIVLTNRRLIVLGETGVIRLKWKLLEELTIPLEEMDEPRLREGHRQGTVTVSGKQFIFSPWTAARPALSAIKEVRTKRLTELSRETQPSESNNIVQH